MRWLFLFLMFLFSVFSFVNNMKIIDVENKIYEMYVNNFEKYLVYESNELIVDKMKVKEDVEQLGSDIVFFNEKLHFKIKLRVPYKYEKEYYFYLEKNNG